MTKRKEYSILLKDPRWQKKRLKILERDGWECNGCGNSETTLHVHHLHYHKNKDPWEYDDNYLISLCEDCHHIEYLKLKEEKDAFCDAFSSKGMMSCHFSEMATAARGMEPFHNPDVMASVISKILMNPIIIAMLCEVYFSNNCKPIKDKQTFIGLMEKYIEEARETIREDVLA